MKLSRLGSYLFLGSLFAIVMIWGYLPRVWIMNWPQMSLLGLSAAGLVLWFVFSLEDLKLWLKKRSTQFAIGLGITAIMSLVFLGTINWLANAYNVKKDLTQNQLHSLSDQTKKIAAGLQEEITIRVWSTNVDQMSTNLDMRRFLENYRLAGNGKIKIEIKNPNEDRPGATVDNVKRNNLIIVKSSSGREARVESFSDTKGEEQMTNALVQAVKGRKKTLCFIAGHGELGLSDSQAQGLSQIKSQLTSSTYDAKEVTLATAEKVPEDCEMLVLVGPRGEGVEREKALMRDYLEHGGKMMALLGAGTPTGWRKFAANYGVTVRADLIVDPRVQPPIAIATKNFAQDVEVVRSFNRLVILPETSSLELSNKLDAGETLKVFVSSENYTFAKAGELKSIRSLRPAGSDVKGPLPVAVLVTKPVAASEIPSLKTPAKPEKKNSSQKDHPATSWWRGALISEAYAQSEEAPHMGAGAEPEKKSEQPEMSLIVFSNHNFVMNSFVGQMGNMDLFLNSVNYLLKDKDLIGIRPREIRQAALELSNESLRQVYATVLLIAGLFLVGGIAAKRRKNALE